MNSMLHLLRRVFRGITWKHPLIHFVLRCLDPLDYLVRVIKGYRKIPRYSIRVRSTGIRDEFGGRQFSQAAVFFRDLLQTYAGLSPGSRVLEIGCGCGRAAVALSEYLNKGQYTGMDIEPVSIEACRRNTCLKKKSFRFDWMDVFSQEYNPGGKTEASVYRFPYPDSHFDVIFLTSVFTHMLQGDVANYIHEIGRMLKPGGRCLFTTFVMDYGQEGYGISFPFIYTDYCLFQKDFPEKAVGYFLKFLDREFESGGLKRTMEPILGPWRDVDVKIQYPKTDFAQDILVYEKT